MRTGVAWAIIQGCYGSGQTPTVLCVYMDPWTHMRAWQNRHSSSVVTERAALPSCTFMMQGSDARAKVLIATGTILCSLSRVRDKDQEKDSPRQNFNTR
jgi:hypothetical protein